MWEGLSPVLTLTLTLRYCGPLPIGLHLYNHRQKATKDQQCTNDKRWVRHFGTISYLQSEILFRILFLNGICKSRNASKHTKYRNASGLLLSTGLTAWTLSTVQSLKSKKSCFGSCNAIFLLIFIRGLRGPYGKGHNWYEKFL